jgi:hypothetical protein
MSEISTYKAAIYRQLQQKKAKRAKQRAAVCARRWRNTAAIAGETHYGTEMNINSNVTNDR